VGQAHLQVLEQRLESNPQQPLLTCCLHTICTIMAMAIGESPFRGGGQQGLGFDPRQRLQLETLFLLEFHTGLVRRSGTW